MLLGSQYVGNEISDVRILPETPANPELPAIKECVAISKMVSARKVSDRNREELVNRIAGLCSLIKSQTY
ncbi:hypothetical protein [Sessilibacter sp. MAH4]